jgi:glycosyltransferase involved in cell wall biosynthesis
VSRYRLSAVMPVRDRFDLALCAIDRIIGQTESPHEILIIDDGSSVPFEQHLLRAKSAANERGIRFEVRRHEVSRGVSAARNHGAALSTGDMICFCDSDDYWAPTKLEVIGNLVSRSRDFDVLFHSFRWKAGTLPIFRVLPEKRLIKLPKWLLASFAFLNPSCACINRAAYHEGFREDMKHHEDLEYFLRLSKLHDIWFYNEPLTEMAREPGSEGGASHNSEAMRRGAVTALEQYVGPTPVGSLAYLKTCYHKAILLFGALRAAPK